MTWVNELVSQHSELETPLHFWYWSALCTISAVVKDNVYLERIDGMRLFPNIYVMLHADSGLKKGPPIGLAKDLVNRVNNTRIISGRSSIQGILKELGSGTSQPGSGRVANKSTGFIASSEFSSSIVSDPAALTILTDLYDTQYNQGKWTSLLKQETFTLNFPCLSMLVATNAPHFEDFVSTKDMHGGFMGRMFLIAEKKVNRLNPLIAPLSNPPNREEMATYLKELAKLKGPFTPLGSVEESDEYPHKREKDDVSRWYSNAGVTYYDWYFDFYEAFFESEEEDETGSVQRHGDSVLKVALLLALSESPDLNISVDNMEEAIRVCEKWLISIQFTTKTKSGMSGFAPQKGKIIQYFLDRDDNRVSRVALMKHMQSHLNANELDDIMQTFDQSNMIKSSQMGGQIIYTMPEETVKSMREFLAKKKQRRVRT